MGAKWMWLVPGSRDRHSARMLATMQILFMPWLGLSTRFLEWLFGERPEQRSGDEGTVTSRAIL
jgi:hypothetical protein